MNNYLNKKDVILDKLKQKIASREYFPGYKFSSEPVMAQEFGVSRVTLRSAFKCLEEENLIVRVPGKGTFINSEADRNKNEKRILILFDDSSSSLESPSKYIIPAFEKSCVRLNIRTDSIDISFLRARHGENIIEQLKKSNYFGVLLNGSWYNGDEKEVSILKKLNIPVLIPHARAEDYKTTGFAIMYCDNKKAWSDGVDFLFKQGHVRFATLGIISPNGVKCLRGFTEVEYFNFLTQIGVDNDPKLLKYVQYRYENIHETIKLLMSTSNPPTTIMCYSDFIAIDVYKSLDNLGYRIPEDIAVMGYCGYPGDHLLSPPLSTVDNQYALIGKMAAKVLCQADEWFGKSEVAVPRIISPHKLMPRESTAIRRLEKQLMHI